jgi:hypothetical protein
MEAIQYHNAKRVFPSALGLHMEFETHEQALAFYQDGTSRGITYTLEEKTVIKPFKKKSRS